MARIRSVTTKHWQQDATQEIDTPLDLYTKKPFENTLFARALAHRPKKSTPARQMLCEQAFHWHRVCQII